MGRVLYSMSQKLVFIFQTGFPQLRGCECANLYIYGFPKRTHNDGNVNTVPFAYLCDSTF